MSFADKQPTFLQQSAPVVARELLGWKFYVRESDGSLTGGIIIETEAYTADDQASHSYRGETKRNSAMFSAAGTIYVYFTYGMHWCCNIVTGAQGSGEAVLLRGIAPTKGLQIMQKRRGSKAGANISNGPAKLCQALGITGAENGRLIGEGRYILEPPDASPAPEHITATTRVGIRHNRDVLWRFVLSEEV